MGNVDLQAYLASKYMSGAKADAILERSSSSSSDPNKKRKKRKIAATDSSSEQPVASTSGTSSSSGFKIADQDDFGWTKVGENEDDDEFKPVVEERRGQFKSKSKTSTTWSTIRDSDPSLKPKSPTPEPEDEKPVVVASRGGLQSAADLKAEQLRLEKEKERKRLIAERERALAKQDATEDEQEEGQHDTVYRDSSGRKIDLKLQKAEEAKRKRQELEREMAKMEWGKGLVQREDKEKQKQEAEKLKRKGVARYADDQEMNEELREVERWNDPAANFLTKNKGEKKKKESKFPQYQGPPPPPNRFNIKPGYRWDGVDRGTGFEAKLMQKRNSASMYKAAAHAFSTEDM
ncbi:Bud13/CWC26 family protein [Sporobolomyces salmoneus]|uniref:Bud13/CWC26 family protein n=1 Tax=Sporobolomyces salmoneus TaxID=183962 RepID=UPI00317BF5E2